MYLEVTWISQALERARRHTGDGALSAESGETRSNAKGKANDDESCAIGDKPMNWDVMGWGGGLLTDG